MKTATRCESAVWPSGSPRRRSRPSALFVILLAAAPAQAPRRCPEGHSTRRRSPSIGAAGDPAGHAAHAACSRTKGKQIDYYEIAVKQFQQFILPQAWSQSNGIDPTTVWSYGSMLDPRPVAEGGTLNYPALTDRGQRNRPVRVKWINGLVDENGDYLPHLFAVDQTLHWANPPGGPGGTDTHGMDGLAVHRARADRDARPRGAHH